MQEVRAHTFADIEAMRYEIDREHRELERAERRRGKRGKSGPGGFSWQAPGS